MEAYLRFMEENPNVGVVGDEDEIYEYDAEGNIIATEKKTIDPLPPIDHSLISYPSFTKNFYIEHPDITALNQNGVIDLLKKLNIRLSGVSPPRPVCSFAHLNLDEALMGAIRKAGFTQPMPIQAAAVPAALGGRDIVGIAKTGSGKTAAFLWPMITHIMAQVRTQRGYSSCYLLLFLVTSAHRSARCAGFVLFRYGRLRSVPKTSASHPVGCASAYRRIFRSVGPSVAPVLLVIGLAD